MRPRRLPSSLARAFLALAVLAGAFAFPAAPVKAWANGGGDGYGTHDWIVDQAVQGAQRPRRRLVRRQHRAARERRPRHDRGQERPRRAASTTSTTRGPAGRRDRPDLARVRPRRQAAVRAGRLLGRQLPHRPAVALLRRHPPAVPHRLRGDAATRPRTTTTSCVVNDEDPSSRRLARRGRTRAGRSTASPTSARRRSPRPRTRASTSRRCTRSSSRTSRRSTPRSATSPARSCDAPRATSRT